MSAALVNLRNAIATNTLTALQRGALTQALDAIIPTFPEPDPSGVAQPPPDEDDSREWTAALYTIQALGSGGGPVPAAIVPTLIFPTIAALEAFDVSTGPTVTGQPAFVQSNGSPWTFQHTPESATVDGITQVPATGVAGAVWTRENISGYLADKLSQAIWVIDPQNVSGHASDENDGFTLLTPLLHKAEVFRQWGYTWSPTLEQSTIIVYLSADTDARDPGLFAPTMATGKFFIQEPNSLPAPSFTGTLLAVTPKNRAANQALRSTFVTATGAMAANLLLVNATRGNSTAFAERNTGAGLWQISQPFMPYPGGGVAPTNTEVDTWANGDAITGYALLHVNLPRIGGQAADLQAGFAGPNHIVFHLNIWDPTPGNFDPCVVDLVSMPLIVESSCSRAFTMLENGVAITGSISNSALTGGVRIEGSSIFVNGGILAGALVGLRQCFVDADTIFSQGSGIQFLNVQLSTPGVFFDANVQADGATFLGGATVVYGSGLFNQRSGNCSYSTGGVAQFPIAGGLRLNGVATGYSNVTVAGLTTVHNLALSPANLDAAAGAAGFGGFAWGGGAAFSQNGLQP